MRKFCKSEWGKNPDPKKHSGALHFLYLFDLCLISRIISKGNKFGTLTVLILLSVHSRASSLASLVTSSDASAMALAQAIRSLLVPPSPRTNCDKRPINKAIFLAAAIMSLSLLDHWRTSWCKPCAATWWLK